MDSLPTELSGKPGNTSQSHLLSTSRLLCWGNRWIVLCSFAWIPTTKGQGYKIKDCNLVSVFTSYLSHLRSVKSTHMIWMWSSHHPCDDCSGPGLPLPTSMPSVSDRGVLPLKTEFIFYVWCLFRPTVRQICSRSEPMSKRQALVSLLVLLTLLWQHMWTSLLVLKGCKTGQSLGLNKSRLVELSVESSLD